MKKTAQLFGKSLDEDDFQTTKKLLSDDCKYNIGSKIINGPTDICNSYEQNMIEGRKKLDKLEWGKSEVEQISQQEYYVHFTDYLTHKGKEHTHKCKQKLTINQDEKIIQIDHVEDIEETKKLNDYYTKVGIKKQM